MKTLRLAAVIALFVTGCTAQTQIDLMQQSRNVDFSRAAKTETARTGISLPAVCETGKLFFRTTAAAGKNLYLCVSANT